MDDIQLVASIAAGDLLAFRDSQFPLAFVNANPGKVECVEYLDQIPSFFPVPRTKNAYILDLRDEKFD
ncbi:hypothetical protein B0H14DRAFT_3461961 [Mycena olivaceomarginata]|nr:hypothetical protein B0H14DRAFT_3461961 [Mycena olivaceomarginata]